MNRGSPSLESDSSRASAKPYWSWSTLLFQRARPLLRRLLRSAVLVGEAKDAHLRHLLLPTPLDTSVSPRTLPTVSRLDHLSRTAIITYLDISPTRPPPHAPRHVLGKSRPLRQQRRQTTHLRTDAAEIRAMITAPLTGMLWFAAKMALTLAAAVYDKTQPRAPRSMYAVKNGNSLPQHARQAPSRGEPKKEGL